MSDAMILDRTESPPTRLRVTGMDCASCAAKVENAVRRLPGIEEIQVSVATETLTVRHGPGTDARAIAATVRSLGYGAEDPVAEAASNAERPEPAWWRAPKALLAFACGAALVLAFAIGQAAPATERWAFLAAMVVGLVPIARRAVAAARHGTPFSIETLMSVAAIGATAIGATEEAATVVFLFLVGEVLEGVAAGRARASIRGLTGLVPDTALLERRGHNRTGAGGELAGRGERAGPAGGPDPGGRDHPRPGRARWTRRRSPARACRGARLRAMRVRRHRQRRRRAAGAGDRGGRDNTIARVVRLVEEAQEAKAPTERLIDRFSRSTRRAWSPWRRSSPSCRRCCLGGLGEWVCKGLAMLLIGCPCALVISTPAAIAAGLSAGARRGPAHQGRRRPGDGGRGDVVAFDKTGTLTEGKPVVTDVSRSAGRSGRCSRSPPRLRPAPRIRSPRRSWRRRRTRTRRCRRRSARRRSAARA